MGHDKTHLPDTIITQKKGGQRKSQATTLATLQQDFVRTQLFTLTHDAMILCDAQQRIVKLNANAEQLYGWREVAIQGQNAHVLLQSRVYTEAGSMQGNPWSEELWEGELEQICQTGILVVVKYRQSWLYDEQGQRIGLLMISQDISALRRLEKSLHDQLQPMNVAQNVGVYTWDITLDRATILTPELAHLMQIPVGHTTSYDAFLRRVHPDDREVLRKTVSTALHRNTDYIQEFRIIDEFQQERWMWTIGRLLYDNHGYPVSLLGVVFDVTGYYHQNESLLNTYQQTREILESITDGFIHLNPDWQVTYMNTRAEQLLRHKREELVGHNIWEMLPHMVGSLIYQKLHYVMQTQENIHFETFYEPWQIWFDVHLYPTPGGVSVYYNDVTRYKRTEIALHTSQTRFRRIFATNFIGMIVSDMTGNILEANDAFLSMIGYTQVDLINPGLNWHQITPAEDAEVDQQAIEDIYERGFSQTFEKEYIRKDGTHIPMLFIGTLVDRNTDTYTSLVIDITLQKELDRQRETFMSIVGHELRTPLTAINGSLQLAQRRMQRFLQNEPTLTSDVETLLAKQLKLLDQSLRQARVQNRLINDMLDISRLAIDRLELSLQPCNLLDIVRETVDDLRYTENDHNIELHLPQTTNIAVLADSDRIGQVVSNYITNALKYSLPDTSINVSVEPVGDEVYVWVRDHGPGLSEEAQQHIWDRYYRSTTKDKHDQKKQGVNLGLGLHICQVLIKRHHGAVGVVSKEGEGSAFWFSLPLVMPANHNTHKHE